MNIIKFLGSILSWLVKNTALLVGIIEATSKLLAGIISLTPTKRDDEILVWVDKVFSWIKKGLYFASDKLAGKDIPKS